MKRLMIKKGYTLHVSSWEDTGEVYDFIQLTVETLDEVKKLHIICTELLQPITRTEFGIGNSYDNDGVERLVKFIDKYPEYFSDMKSMGYDELVETFQELVYPLVGDSQFYDFRVCESLKITFSPEDVYNDFVIL